MSPDASKLPDTEIDATPVRRRIVPLRWIMPKSVLVGLGVGFAASVGLGTVAMETGLPPRWAWTSVGVIWTGAYAIFASITLHRQREAHALTENLLVAILEKSRAGRMILDDTGNAVCANSEIVRLVHGDTTDRGLLGLFADSGDSERSYQELWRLATSGEDGIREILSKTVGALFEVAVTPIPHHPGYSQWRLSDRTHAHLVEEERKAERSKLIDFLNNAPGGFFSVGAGGEFLFVNQTFADWVGSSIEALLSGAHRLHEFLETPPLNAKPYDLVQGGGLVQHGEVVFRALDGRLFPAAIAQTVVEDDGGIRTRAIVRDLLEEREWQAALAQSQKRFHRFFEDAPIGIAQVDSAGIVAECNPMMAAIIGRPMHEVKGLPIDELLVPQDLHKVTSILKSAEIPDHPIEVRLKSDHEAVAQLFVRLLHNPGGADTTFVLHFIDFTERKNLEQQFAQSQKMQAVGQLAGGIAHDFNNLLTAMIGFCDLLLLRHKPGDSSFGDIMQIKQNANRAANLVRQLLAFSRQQTLQPRVLDVTDALTELLHLLRRLIGENIELKMVHGRDLGLVRVDQGQLEQVLINLCVNARDAMPRGGKLTIKTGNRKTRHATRVSGEDMPAGDWVAISVSDTGTGIPPNILTRIFEPFFSTKEVGSGTGLGLSTVYGIVRQTGGYVHVDSTIDEGSTFWIYLPRFEATEKDAVESPEGNQEKPAGDLTGVGQVLLVEDEDAVRMFSARALRNKGYQVHEANSGEAALAVFADPTTPPIDLLITDVIMPQMDGPTLVMEVRKTQPELKVIFISGYTEDKVRSQFASNEEIHFLPKPFTLKQLAVKVKEVMHPEG
jgi:two-component system cell cycle sensor histidine kinase/response regulator CckA